MGISVRDLLRGKGTPYGELGLADPKWTDDALIDQMLAHPILINRPIVVTPLGVQALPAVGAGTRDSARPATRRVRQGRWPGRGRQQRPPAGLKPTSPRRRPLTREAWHDSASARTARLDGTLVLATCPGVRPRPQATARRVAARRRLILRGTSVPVLDRGLRKEEPGFASNTTRSAAARAFRASSPARSTSPAPTPRSPRSRPASSRAARYSCRPRPA